MRSWKMVFIIVWNVVGKLVSPKNMTVGSYRPLLVMKAAFYRSFSLMRTLLYPYLMLKPVNSVQSHSWLVNCGIRGRG